MTFGLDGFSPSTTAGPILTRLEASRLVEAVADEDKYSLTHEYLVEKINRARKYWIPSDVFRDIKRFRSRIPMTKEGEQLFKKSAARFYGIRAAAIGLCAALLVFLAHQSYHLFYLVPNQYGRVLVHIDGATADSLTRIISVSRNAGDRPNLNRERRPLRTPARPLLRGTPLLLSRKNASLGGGLCELREPNRSIDSDPPIEGSSGHGANFGWKGFGRLSALSHQQGNAGGTRRPVSYTHLTLPTILRV